MQTRFLPLFLLSFFLCTCEQSSTVGSLGSGTKVTTAEELKEAIKAATPGDVITLANGSWNDLEIHFEANGAEGEPITLRAETPGEVILQGQSNLSFGGDHLVVDGLTFTNGYSPSRSVIRYATDDDKPANHCRVTNCVIDGFNKPQRNQTDIWVSFRGRHNQLDHCYITGKSNRGPTIRVDLEGNQSIKNYHKINANHFGPRPPKGGPSAETIQIGNSYTSMAPSHTQVTDNLFDRCNGEVEVISSKTNFNEFRNNVFYHSEGSLVTRHGNYCTVDGNYFIGDGKSTAFGGIRLIGSGHIVTNNYFYGLVAGSFRSPLAVMNGIPKSPLNRYIQVTDVVVAHNSWINCKSPLQFGIGSNVDQKDVLPASEIRSEAPIRTTVANNLIYNETADPEPLVAHDKIDGILFASNVVNNQGGAFEPTDGFVAHDFGVKEVEAGVYVPDTDLSGVELYSGFEFEKFDKDLFGSSRTSSNAPGAVSGASGFKPNLLDLNKYGPDWYDASEREMSAENHNAATTPELIAALKAAQPGDIITLAANNYTLTESLSIDKLLTVKSADAAAKTTITYSGPAGTPAFAMHPGGKLTLDGVKLVGGKSQSAFASLKEGMSSLYNLTVKNSEVSGFDYLLKGYKYSFSEFLRFENSTFRNCTNGIELSEETEDKGEYNAENIIIANCTFDGITQNVVDYYRGGYDESTVGGTLTVRGSTFTNCGRNERGPLLNTYGIINVTIDNNTFRNNPVRVIAQLWGAKNNSHANNTITNSGKIVVEENLKLKLLY